MAHDVSGSRSGSSLTPPAGLAGLAAALLAIAPGCLASPDDPGAIDEPSLGEIQQDVAWTGTYWLGHEGGLTEPFDLGSSDDRTCFLSAVNGGLSHGWITVRIERGRWKLRMVGAPYGTIGAGVVCISSVGNRVSGLGWLAGQPAAPIAQVTPQRRCFLSAVSGGYASWIAGDLWDDWVGFVTLNNQIYLDGNLPHPAGGITPAGAEAVCVDTTYGGGVGWVSGPYTTDLADNTSGGWACGLVSIGGSFEGYNYDGPEITYDAAAKRWRISSDAGRAGYATCVK